MCDRVGVMAYGRLVALGPPGSLRGDADGVRLEVDDAAAAAAVVRAFEGVSLIDDADPAAGPGVLRVSVADRDTVAALNAALVGAGVAVHALVPERSSLEDVFLSLVEGADVPR